MLVKAGTFALNYVFCLCVCGGSEGREGGRGGLTQKILIVMSCPTGDLKSCNVLSNAIIIVLSYVCMIVFTYFPR